VLFRSDYRDCVGGLFSKIKKADSSMDSKAAVDILMSMFSGDYDDNKAVIEFFTSRATDLSNKIVEVKKAAVASQIQALQIELGNL
jgi:hypothetical protein